MNVNLGDIWNRKDSFYVQDDEFYNTPDNVLTAFTANPQSHEDDWIKVGPPPPITMVTPNGYPVA
jgi:hypothetical protein